MLEIGIAIAFIGSLIAGVLDLKYTEFPDDIPYIMIALALFIWFINAISTGDIFSLGMSIFLGLLFSLIGYLAFKLGAWGDGDAAILAAIVFLIPSLIFMVGFVFNLLIVAIIYLVIYAFVIGIRHEKVRKEFSNEIKNKWYIILILVITFPIILSLSFALNSLVIMQASFLWLIIVAMVVFLIFSKKIEKYAFRRKIPGKNIRPGDVLASSREWIGITEEEAEKIQKNLKFVEIKEGVRFTIVFPIAIAVTYFIGNLLLLFI